MRGHPFGELTREALHLEFRANVGVEIETQYSIQRVEVKVTIFTYNPVSQPRILESPAEKIYRSLHLEEAPTGLLGLCVITL